MAYTLSNKCAKNLCKRTVLHQLIIKNVVTCFFGTQCICTLCRKRSKTSIVAYLIRSNAFLTDCLYPVVYRTEVWSVRRPCHVCWSLESCVAAARRSGQFCCCFVANFLQYLCAKIIKSTMRFHKIITKIKTVHFFAPQCSVPHEILWRNSTGSALTGAWNTGGVWKIVIFSQYLDENITAVWYKGRTGVKPNWTLLLLLTMMIMTRWWVFHSATQLMTCRRRRRDRLGDGLNSCDLIFDKFIVHRTACVVRLAHSDSLRQTDAQRRHSISSIKSPIPAKCS